MKPLLHFQRYECKYLVPERKAQAIRRLITPYVRLDSHAEAKPLGRYPIVSLYLDSPQLRLHRETIEGQHSRFKLRVRGYSDLPQDHLFLEIKRRHNQVVTKSRVMVSRSEVRDLLEGRGVRADGRSERDRRCIEEFEGLVARTGALPVVSVSYEREAYEGIFDRRARVTLDRQIACRPSPLGEIRLAGDGWMTVEGRRVVLELKFDGRLPHWMQQVIHALELERISYSKYSNSVVRSSDCLMRFNLASH